MAGCLILAWSAFLKQNSWSLFVPIFLSGALGFCLTRVFLPLFSKLFLYLDLLDRPDGLLKKHQKPIPYSGGPAIVISTIISTLILGHFYKIPALGLFLVPFFLLGFLDDIFGISQKVKFLIQAVLACLVLYFFQVKFFPLSLFFSMAVINAFNLIDIADGLCSTVSLCASAGFFICALVSGSASWAIFFSLIFGSVVGFMLTNLPPAKAYLGDSGSTFLGAFFGFASVLIPWKSTCDGFLASLLVLGLALSEVFFLCLIRICLGIAPYRGSPHHFYIFLKNKGWSPKKILSFVACVGCELSVVGAGLLSGMINRMIMWPFAIFALMIWIIVVYL